MTAAPLHFRDERLMLDPAGAAFWPAKRVLIVADLHFEKSSSLAARGVLLPPYDTRATLERLNRLVRLYRPKKVTGNHDAAPTGMPGLSVTQYREGPFTFRHQALPALGPREIEISGHFHPKASIEARAKRVSRACFVTDATRLMLPAFGAYTGGLDVHDPAISRLFPRGLRVFLLGQDQLFSFALEQLGRMAEVA